MTTLPRLAKATFLAMALCLSITLCSTTVLAADHGPKSATTQVPAIRHHQISDDQVVAPKKIYSTLGPTDDLYDASTGWFVSGINNQFNFQKQDIAIPFTPVHDATVTRVKAALQYYGFGANGALLAIYSDANGLPGKVLAKRRRGHFSDFGSGCCELSYWTLKTPLAVKARTQYWVVGTTNNETSDSINTWDWVFDDAPGTFAYQQNDGGWILLNASFGYSLTGVAVRGTVP